MLDYRRAHARAPAGARLVCRFPSVARAAYALQVIDRWPVVPAVDASSSKVAYVVELLIRDRAARVAKLALVAITLANS